MLLLDRTENVQAVQVGQADIEQHDVWLVLVDQLESRLAVRGLRDLVAPVGDFLSQGPANQVLIVYD